MAAGCVRNSSRRPHIFDLALPFGLLAGGIFDGLLHGVAVNAMTKKATVEVALSQRWVYRRRLRFLIAGLVVVCSLALMALGTVLIGQAIGGVLMIALGIIGCLGGLLYGLNASSVVAAKRIVGDYIWLIESYVANEP